MINAAIKGHVNCVELLVQKGANLEAMDNVRDEYDDHIYSVRGEGRQERGEGRGKGEGYGREV